MNSWACHNKISHSVWLKQQMFTFYSLEAKKPKIRVPAWLGYW